jgi:putative FmdB family regulatory protein
LPTYEYTCTDCGEHLEVVQSFADDALTECPHCGGNLRKVFGNVGIVFKGSGFYKNDSRSKTSSVTPANAGSSSDTSTSTDTASPSTPTESSSSSTPAAAPAAATPPAAPAAS